MSEPAATVDAIADELLGAIFGAYPVIANMIGLPSPGDLKVADYRESAEAELSATMKDIAARAAAVDETGLTAEALITRQVIREQAFGLFARLDAKAVEFTVCPSFTSAAIEQLVMVPMMTIGSPNGAEIYAARLEALPGLLEALADRHRAGVAAGRVPVRPLVEGAIEHIERYLDGADDPLRAPNMTDDPGFDKDEYRDRLERILAERVRPAYAAYRDVLRDEILEHGRDADRPGLSWLPGGTAYYQDLVRIQTTTDRTAEDLHRTGLDLVAQLAGEYREIGARVFGTDDLDQIFDRLRTDPAFRWKDAGELLDHARASIARAEAAAPQWFGRIPEGSCDVRPVPDDEAPGAAPAYYSPPALDGSRSGIFFANTYQVTDRDRFTSEATAFHEAVPGHHFQISISQKLTDLPLLRRIAPFAAYAEGWGLYAERLADEMGLYSDDVARLGMLANDSLRAVRLVVDTGLHAKGWTRQQAVDYMAANAPAPLATIESEVDRYIADPAQALAYMVGRLEIQRIRADAEAALGSRFDVRAFHDVVLGNGSVPLPALERLVAAWVATVPA
jgi:uncharacterized protein (DUF885 family)